MRDEEKEEGKEKEEKEDEKAHAAYNSYNHKTTAKGLEKSLFPVTVPKNRLSRLVKDFLLIFLSKMCGLWMSYIDFGSRKSRKNN